MLCEKKITIEIKVDVAAVLWQRIFLLIVL